MRLFGQPTEELTDREGQGRGKVRDGQAIAWGCKEGEGAIGPIDEHDFFFGVDEPAHLGAVGKAMEDIANDFGLALIGGEDLDRPVGGTVKQVGDVALGITGNVFPAKNGDVGHDRSPTKGTTEFGVGAGDMLGFEDGVDGGDQFTLKGAVFALGHGLLDDLSIDEFAGGFGFR